MKTALRIGTMVLVFGTAALSGAQSAKETSFQSMAPIQLYRMANRSEEIALARSAAPASISNDAEVLVLGERSYEVAVEGKNGFVCLVERSWLASFDDTVFWNPRIRGPDCLNPAAVETVLPMYLERTQWALSGVSSADMIARAKTSIVAQQAPAPGAMGYMMSKEGHLSDTDGHWHPHLMFFEPRTAVSVWGANLPGSPLFGHEGGPTECTVLFIPVSKWSDGSSAAMDMP